MTGICGRERDKQVIWELTRQENGDVILTFRAEEGAGISDYRYEVSNMLPPWADYEREITEIRLDSRIEVIGRQCFRGMDRLREVRFAKEDGQVSRLRTIGAQAFQDCRNLTEIRIPDSVVEIGNNAFQAAERLSRVKIGTGLSRLGSEVFACDVSLKELYIGSEHLEEVGEKQFTLNHLLSDFYCPGESAGAVELRSQFARIRHNGGEEEKLFGAREAAFVASKEAGRSRDLREDSDHGALTDTVQYHLQPVREEEYCLIITGTGAMPEWVSRENQPWRGRADSITEVKVEEGITAIGSSAFSGLTKLCRVWLPKTVKSVGIAAFGECAGLTELRFQEGMEDLGCRALWGCANLTTLWLPETFRVANLLATAYCPRLKHIFFAGSKARWKRDVIIDNMMERNSALTGSEIHFGKEEKEEEDGGFQDDGKDMRAELYQNEVDRIAMLLKANGDGKFHVVAVNLGDSCLLSKIGDSTLLIFPEGGTMLIDTGACGAGKCLTDFLRSIGLKRLDYLVFTHPHGDHFGGALELFRYLWEEKNGGIGQVWYSGAMMDSQVVQPAMQALAEKSVPLHLIKAEEDAVGERPAHITIEGVELSVYGPNERDIQTVNHEKKGENANNASLVFRFCYGETVFVTAGDIYRTKERYLLSIYGPEPFRADLMKMNHHGNFQGNIPEWVSETHPRIAFAEADGNGNSDVMRRYAEAGTVCYSTGLDGMLHFSMGREKDVNVFHQFDSLLRKQERI